MVLDFENVLLILIMPWFFVVFFLKKKQNMVCLENNLKLFALLFNINLVTVGVGKCIDLKPIVYFCFCKLLIKHTNSCQSIFLFSVHVGILL